MAFPRNAHSWRVLHTVSQTFVALYFLLFQEKGQSLLRVVDDYKDKNRKLINNYRY